MRFEDIASRMLAGYMPGGYAAVTRRQVVQFLMKEFHVDESTVTRWRQKGAIPQDKAEALVVKYPEFKEAADD